MMSPLVKRTQPPILTKGIRRRCWRRRTLGADTLRSSATSAMVNSSTSGVEQSAFFKERSGAGNLSSPAGVSTLSLMRGWSMQACCVPTLARARRGVVTTSQQETLLLLLSIPPAAAALLSAWRRPNMLFDHPVLPARRGLLSRTHLLVPRAAMVARNIADTFAKL